MTIWVSSDWHIGHSRILEYCSRPFSDVNHMNEALIKNWNECVKPDDTTIVLGDCFMGQIENIDKYMPRLCMGKYSILRSGNHDKGKRHKLLEKYFNEIHDETATIYYNGKAFLITHNPKDVKYLDLANDEYLLYGHVHDNAPTGYDKETRSFHVGVDTNNYRPVDLDEICRQIDEAEQDM